MSRPLFFEKTERKCQFIGNGFIRSGIAGALDVCYDEECDKQSTEDDSDNNSDTNEEDLLEDNIIVIK